jgi:hypothetical protein
MSRSRLGSGRNARSEGLRWRSGEQELGDQVVFKPGSRAGIERHVARPPAPDAPGKRFVDAKNGGKGGAHRARLADRADEQKNRANFDVGK